jgi:hypothetical protein
MKTEKTLWGPSLLPEIQTDQLYRDIQKIVLPGLFEDGTLVVRQRLWFQHNGVPGHYDVQQWLDATCPGWWIGRRSHSLLDRRI